jgi:hypothetical protein
MMVAIDTEDGAVVLEGEVTLEGIADCITVLKQIGAAMAAGMQAEAEDASLSPIDQMRKHKAQADALIERLGDDEEGLKHQAGIKSMLLAYAIEDAEDGGMDCG